MADNIFKDWLDSTEEFKKKADAVLAEVHKAKQEMLALRNEIMDRLDEGQFIRDDKRIVISAPEIIIGNVNHFGDLQGAGKVTIKGHSINIHGVGEAGTVDLKAPIIRQVAVNPGIDGEEEVVDNTKSIIISRARTILVDSENPEDLKDRGGVFLGGSAVIPGVNIFSDAGIIVSAVNANKEKKEAIVDAMRYINAGINEKETNVQSKLDKLSKDYKHIQDLIQDDKVLSGNDEKLGRANFAALDMISATYQDEVTLFSKDMYDLVRETAKLAELKRRKACMDNALKNLPADKEYKEKFTGSALMLNSEVVNINNIDGDGNWRTNKDSHINLIGNNVKLQSRKEDGSLPDDTYKSRISLISRNIDLLTTDTKDVTYDDYDEMKTAKFPAVGNVTIRSKTVDIESMDYEQTDKNSFNETALTEGSSINIRSEKVKVKTINHEGKSVGKFSVNSQKITMKATDIKEYDPQRNLDDQGNYKHPDKEKMKSDKVAENSTMLLFAEKMSVGYKEKKKNQVAKKIQVACSDNLLLVGDTVEVGNDNDLALFKDGVSVYAKRKKNLTLTGKETKICGDIALEGPVNASCDVTVQNLTAEKCIKSPNFTDGIGTPIFPKPLTEEEAIQCENYDEEGE